MKMEISENLRVEKLNEGKIIDGENNILFLTAFLSQNWLCF